MNEWSRDQIVLHSVTLYLKQTNSGVTDSMGSDDPLHLEVGGGGGRGHGGEGGIVGRPSSVSLLS